MKVLSGGQTGVDRAALDVALELGLPCGGWCPAGRWAEDGRISEAYPLRETPCEDPAQRTEWNVRDANATVILAPEPLSGGSSLTAEIARSLGRPFRVLDPFRDPPEAALEWLEGLAATTLNVAGPRESECPGVYRSAREMLREMLR